jgi:hypothetical protein
MSKIPENSAATLPHECKTDGGNAGRTRQIYARDEIEPKKQTGSARGIRAAAAMMGIPFRRRRGKGGGRGWLAGWSVTLVRAPLMPLSSLADPPRVSGWGTVAGGLVSGGEAGVTRGEGKSVPALAWPLGSGRGRRKRAQRRGGACILFFIVFSGSIIDGEGDVRPRKQRRCLSLFACSCVDAVHASRSHTRWAQWNRCTVRLLWWCV